MCRACMAYNERTIKGLMMNKKINKIKLILVMGIFIGIIVFLAYVIMGLLQKNTNVDNSIPGLILENNTAFVRKFYPTEYLSKGQNIYIIKEGGNHYLIKVDDKVGKIDKTKAFYINKNVNEEMSLMSDVSQFNYKSGLFKTKEDYQLFLIKNNIRYVYIRMGGRSYGQSGSIYFDDNFEIFKSACEHLKIPYGYYFVTEAINESEALEEAEEITKFVNKNKGKSNKLPFVIDLEYTNGKSRTDEIWDQRAEITQVIIDKLKSNNIDSIVYSNAKRASKFLSGMDTKFWLAYYPYNGKIPKKWYSSNTEQEATSNLELMSKMIAWQFSENGAENDSISEKVDLNLIITSEWEKYIEE